MATYNVGNIEVGAIGNVDNALSSLDKIISKLEQVKNNSNINVKATKKFNKELSKSNNTSNTLNKSFNQMFNLGKMYAIYNYSKRLIDGMIRLVRYASDYAEILNKFEVSFGNLYEENLQYVNQLSKAYGFSKSTLMDYQSTFNNMLKSLKGLTDESSALLSQTLTRMAIDYSSLFNKSIESTMRAFESMLSGSIRPIREGSGFDVSETSIFQIYRELGGTKTMRQLNQLEKRLLRILAVQQQMGKVGAFSDFERTIESFSNQVKIFQEQIKEFGTTWGKLILVALKPILQFVNGILLALNEIGNEITKNIDLTADFKIDEEFAGLESGALEAEEAVEELNESLTQLGLDQLNVIGGTGNGVSTALGVDENILEAVGKYSSKLDDIQYKAKEIAEEVLKWLGYTRDLNGELKFVGSTFTKMVEPIIFIIDGIVGFFDFIATSGSAQVVLGTISAITGLVILLTTGNPIGLIISGVTILIGLLGQLFKSMNSDILNNVFNGFANGFISVIETIGNLFVGLINFFIDIINGFLNLFDPAGLIDNRIAKLDYISIPRFQDRLPQLANGNVATTPTLAIFGEYANAKNDPEITSPKSIMQETFLESIMPLANAILKGDQEVVKAIKQKDLSFKISGRELAEQTYGDYENVAERRGKNKLVFNK